MDVKSLKRIPRHIGFIPDGNRRWAELRGLPKASGYEAGIAPGIELMRTCMDIGVREVSIYGFTQDNAKRPKEQTVAFSEACVRVAHAAVEMGVELFVLGDHESKVFPRELKPYVSTPRGESPLRVNLLVNYGWSWDLQTAMRSVASNGREIGPIEKYLASSSVSRIDLVVRWGGHNRLSGFLPVQSVYSDIYIVDALWPDYKPEHFMEALEWYQGQDVTLGG